jgi:hemolysin III
MPVTPTPPPFPEWSRGEEIANAVSHGVGVVAALVALPFLVLTAATDGDAWHIVGSTIFGVTLILMYTASTLYHAFPPSRLKHIFRSLDHAAIYLLIAGTYTPFTLGSLRGAWGWSLFGVVWGLAFGGIVVKSFLGPRGGVISTIVYVLMGWVMIVAYGPLTRAVGSGGIAWLGAGGLAYTAGILFYGWHRMPYSHMVWHLFVLTGSMCHLVAVLRYSAAL